jgi:ribosomal protein S18 acetylase RimI-like enzyme
LARVLIKQAESGDREAFLGPALRSWLDAYDGVLHAAEVADAPAMLERAWAKRWNELRLAWLDGEVAGFYSLGAADDPETVNYIWHVYVDPRAQRRGVGRALNDAALAEIWLRGAATAWLDVLAANTKARAFYAALGWRERGRGSYGDAEEIILECEIP